MEAYHAARRELSISAGIGRSSLDKFQRRPANKIPGIEPVHQGSCEEKVDLLEAKNIDKDLLNREILTQTLNEES